MVCGARQNLPTTLAQLSLNFWDCGIGEAGAQALGGNLPAGLTQLEVARRMIEEGQISRAGYLRALQTLQGFTLDGTLPEPYDFSRVPYTVGTQIRVLKPDTDNRSWIVAGEYATPRSYQAN